MPKVALLVLVTALAAGETDTDGAETDTDTDTETTADDGIACADIYDPVCGVDGMTYGNECSAVAAGVEIRRKGECVGDCSGGNCASTDPANTPSALALLLLVAAFRRRRRR